MTASATEKRSNDNKIGHHPRRSFSSHTPKWQRYQNVFITPSNKAASISKNDTQVYAYHRQYSHVYAHRLDMLRPRCWKLMTKDTYNYARVDRVLDLREDKPSMLVGTIIKETDNPKEDPVVDGTRCRPSDRLYLEDSSGRVALGTENVHEYCTGLVVGVKGTVDSKGTLNVGEFILPNPVPLAEIDGKLIPSTPAAHPPHLLLVSSLLCGDPNVPSLPREMLLSYLQGQFTPDAAQVSHIVLAGAGPSSTDTLQGLKDLDAFGVQLSRAGIPLDVMPSKNDPTTANWPQRPLHSSLLPHSTTLLFRTPNPYAACHGNKFVIGTDGLNVTDLQQSVLTGDKEKLTELEALEKTLEFAHVCPTGPDSVPTLPHIDSDPMVVDKTPHLYFCGNASEFATKQNSTGTTFVCVPKFSETGEVVLVNLETLDVQLIRFEDNSD